MGVVSILVFVGFSSFHILLASFLSFVVLGVYLAWIGIQYFGTHLVITSQRILASSRSGIFVFDRRELRLENLKETIMGKQHALEVILHF